MIMKKAIAAVLAILLLSLFTGCSLYDADAGSNISMFVDPTTNVGADISPEDNADPVEKTPESVPADDTPQDGLVRIDNPDILDEYFYGDGFRLYIPFVWRSRIALDVLTVNTEDTSAITYDFFYVQDDGVEAKVITIISCDTRYLNANRSDFAGAAALGQSEAADRFYYMLQPSEALPDDFLDVSEWLDIYTVIANNESFEVV